MRSVRRGDYMENERLKSHLHSEAVLTLLRRSYFDSTVTLGSIAQRMVMDATHLLLPLIYRALQKNGWRCMLPCKCLSKPLYYMLAPQFTIPIGDKKHKY